MIHLHPLSILYFITILAALSAGLIQWKKLDLPARILCALFGLTFLSEISAWRCALHFGNNMAVYHFFSPVQFLLICTYFNYTIDIFRKYSIGYIIGISGLLLALTSTLYIQPCHSINSVFLLFESLMIAAISLFAFFRLLLEEEAIDLKHQFHFWSTGVFFLFWTLTMCYWGLFNAMKAKLTDSILFIQIFILLLNILCYVSMFILFCFTQRLKFTHERKQLSATTVH